MKTETKNGCTIGGGILVPILTIIFVIGKVFGYLDWSWWWVFSPIWINFGIVILCLLLWVFGLLISELLNPFNKYKR